MSELAQRLINREKKDRTGYLDLGNCGLTELPNLSDLHWLQTLIVSNSWFDWEQNKYRYSQNDGESNQISIIAVHALPRGLTNLFIRGDDDDSTHWKISSWQFLKDVPHLKQIDLSVNKISKANFLKHLPNLTHLNLSSNKISDLSFLEHLTNLEALYLRYNKISDITPIENLENLITLDLRSNQISDITSVDALVSIITLGLSRNQIIDASPLGYLSGLTTVDLSYNKINKIDFFKNQNLTTLDLSVNQISDLYSIENLTNLTSLNLRRNKITDASPLKDLTNLTALNLSGNKISNINFLENLTKLTTLSIKSDQIYDATILGHLTSLESLRIEAKEIRSVHFLEDLKTLSELSIRTPKVQKWHYIKGLTNLKSLDLTTTDSAEIGDMSFLENLTGLTELHLPNKQITDISCLKKLTKLTQLDLSSNQITDITPIQTIIQNGVPASMEEHNRDGITLYENPIKNPPIEIVHQGNAAILQYFKERDRAKQSDTLIRPPAEAKCLIIGEGGAGKTSLTQKLLNSNNPLPSENDITESINVHPHHFNLSDGTEFCLNIWDFGGQEIYHATHQFFLTKRSLYILLDDTRKDDKTVNDPTFNYWLQVAELYGDGSPLIIVQNEKGDRSKQIDLRSIQARFGFVKDVKSTNLLTCKGLDKVWESIEFWLKQLPHMGEEQPQAWFSIRRELEHLALKNDYISLEEYFRICSQYTIPEIDRALFLSKHLHDIGVFLHFQEHRLLRKILILNNQWVTDAVYKVLNSEPVKSAYGRFTRDDLSGIWADSRYGDHEDKLLALMEKFEICYKLPNEKTDTWLVPQLLSALQPEDFSWDESDNLQLRYEYEFMPKGLLSQHIVRMNRYVRQSGLAWKTGVVFERSGSQALVTEIWGNRSIQMRVKGTQAKELFTLLSEDLDVIHTQFKGLKVKKMIPCNCHICIKSVTPQFYDNKKLTGRLTDGKLTVRCGESDEDISLAGLLDWTFAKISPREKQGTGAKKIFISYSHKDEDAMKELNKFLGPLERKGDIIIWTDQKILPGQNWKEEILRELKSADLILLLVSANFLESDFIYEHEISLAIQQMNDHGKLVVPIILNHCHWEKTALKDLQATPKDGRPIKDFKNFAKAWTEVTLGIDALLKAL